MDYNSLDWDHARVFLAVARAGTLAQAAARLGLDVSTVSRRLARLEEALGVHLFDRTREGTSRTAAAEALLGAAEEMERAMGRLLGAVGAVETQAEGVVRISVVPGVADAFVAPLLPAFHRRYPGITVELDASVRFVDLDRREADLAIRTERPREGPLVVVKLNDTTWVPLGAPGYVRELGRLRRLEDARWIVWDKDLAHLPGARWLGQFGRDVRPVLRTSHFASQLSAAAAGLGLILAPEPYQTAAPLERVPLGRALAPAAAALPVETLWLAAHRALRAVPRVAALWDFLHAELSHPERAGELVQRRARG